MICDAAYSIWHLIAAAVTAGLIGSSLGALFVALVCHGEGSPRMHEGGDADRAVALAEMPAAGARHA